jgi:hypothetical protein
VSDLGGPDADSLPWLVAGVRGLARAREWDAVATVDVAELRGSRLGELELRVRADGTAAPAASEVPPEAVDRIIAALAGSVEPPYVVQAVRQSEVTWSIGATALTAEPVDLPAALSADSIEVVVAPDGDVTAYADGEPIEGGSTDPDLTAALEMLERMGSERFECYVARAERVGADRWEATVDPL